MSEIPAWESRRRAGLSGCAASAEVGMTNPERMDSFCLWSAAYCRVGLFSLPIWGCMQCFLLFTDVKKKRRWHHSVRSLSPRLSFKKRFC